MKVNKNINLSDLKVYLKEGEYYKCGNKTYLIGAKVPAIANVFVCKVTKNGDLGEIDVMYHRQNKNWKLLKNGIIIKDKHKERLQELFCYGLTDFHNKKRNHNLPIVYEYLECYRINTIKKYAKSRGEKNINEFMLWVIENCKYYARYNQLVHNLYNFGWKSDEELYDMFKSQKATVIN